MFKQHYSQLVLDVVVGEEELNGYKNWLMTYFGISGGGIKCE